MHVDTRPDGTSSAPDRPQSVTAPGSHRENPASWEGWRWVAMWTSIILFAASLPYLVAWAATPAGYQFTGILVNPVDGHTYLAKIRQGWEGAWLFHLTYTPEPHTGAAVYLFYLALGHAARLAGLPLVAVFHAARLLAGLALLLTLYAFARRLSPAEGVRRLLFGLAGATAGLGWLGSMVGLLPIDLWVPEAFAFYSLLTNPHFPLALALMLAAVYGLVWPARAAWCWLLPGLCGVVLGMVAPFALPALYATLGLYVLLLGGLSHRTRAIHEVRETPDVLSAACVAGGVVLASAPWLVYDLWVFSTNPVFAGWAAQDVTPTPSALNLALGFGLLAPAAVAGIVGAVRHRDRVALVLALWIGVTLALLVAPVALQRRLITGLGLPIGLLAGLGLTAHWLRRGPEVGMDTMPPETMERTTRATVLAKLVLAVGLVGSAFLLVIFPVGALSKATATDPTGLSYLAADESAAMQWLDANARGAVVLAPPRYGAMLPGQAGVRVFYGHPFETLNAASREAQTTAFFAGQMADAEWGQLVDADHIHYVFVGPAEQDSVRLPAGLEPVFQHGGVTIYRAR